MRKKLKIIIFTLLFLIFSVQIVANGITVRQLPLTFEFDLANNCGAPMGTCN
jgi:hypothetical protein